MEFCCASSTFTCLKSRMSFTAEQSVDEAPSLEKVFQSLQLVRDNEKIPQVVETCLRDFAEFLDSALSFNYFQQLERISAHKIVLNSMTALFLNADVQRNGAFILTKLLEGSEKVRLDFEVLKVHELVLKIMKQHPQDICIHAVGCSLVANLLRFSRNLYQDLVQENAVDVILQSMENFADEDELQVPACQLLNQLLSCDCYTTKLTGFVITGKHSLIMQIMKTHINSGEIAQPVCQLLSTLASSESVCQILSDNQAFTLVLEVMKKHSLLPDIQAAGCKFMCHLCEMQMIDGLLVMQGARDVALCALREHRKNASVQSEALRLLKYITVAIAVTESEGIKDKHWLQDIYIAMATHGDQPEIQRLSCECILQLIDCCPDLCEVVGDPDVSMDNNRVPLHSSVMAAIMLHPDNVDVCTLACQSISCFARCSCAIRNAFITKGVHLSLQKLMQCHPSVAVIQQWCCNALRLLCTGNTSKKELLITSNMFEEVAKCLFSFPKNSLVQQEAIALIACWSTDSPLVRHQCAVELVHLHILDRIRCFTDNILLLEMAFEAFGALCAAEEIPQLLVDAGIVETILSVMQEHNTVAAIQQKACILIQVLATLFTDSICEAVARRITEAMCIHTDDERVQTEACVALHVIGQIDAAKSDILVNCCAHERLFRILQKFPPGSQVCDLASECLWFLGCVRDLKPRMLLTACASGLVCAAECLIRVGADVNSGEGYNTPLCFACMNNQEDMVKYLLTQVVTDVQTALRLCLEMEYHNLVGILLQHLGFDKEAGSFVLSGLNLGAVHPEWITPALLGDNYNTQRNEKHSRWSNMLIKGKEFQLRRGELNSNITTLSGSLDNEDSLLKIGSCPGQETISLESLRNKMDETIAEESSSSSSSGRADHAYELTDVFLSRAESKSGASFPYSPYDPRVVSPFFKSNKVLLPRSADIVSDDSVVDSPCLDKSPGSFFYYRRTSEVDDNEEGSLWSIEEAGLKRSSFSFDDAFFEANDSDFESFTSAEETPRKSPRLSAPSRPISSPFHMPNNSYLCHFTSRPREEKRRAVSCGVMSEPMNSALEVSESEIAESPSRLRTLSARKRKTSACVKVPNAKVKHIDLSSNAIRDLHDLSKASHMLLLHLFNVQKLDLSQNNLRHFPSKLCEVMPRLRHVSLRRNEFEEFPYRLLHNNHLSFLDLSHNNMNVLQRPQSRFLSSIMLEQLDLSYNELKSFPDWFHEIFPGLNSLALASNKLESLPPSSVNLCRLKTLDISDNKLKEIPVNFLSECHCLEKLDASFNLLKSLPEMDASSFPKLWKVKVAQNALVDKAPFFIPRFLLNLQNLQCLDISNNDLTDLPEPMVWQSVQLKDLNLSRNKIKKFPLKEGVANFANLERLDLSHNNLRRVPNGIGSLISLTSLNLGNNASINNLPDEMGKLANLFELQLDGLKLDMEKSILESKTKDLVGHLHSKLKNSVPYYRMKLVLLGMSGRGKTAIRNVLLKDRHAGDANVTVRDWNVRDTKLRCNHCSKKCINYTVSIWDLKGQDDLFCLFQCTLSSRAVYLAVYDVTKGPEEIINLKPWLLSIHANVPDASVILVGTHHDKVPREKNDSVLKNMKDTARKLCSNPGIPEIRGHIVLDAQHESPGVKLLRNKVTEVILRCKCVSHTLVGTQVPLNFVYLQEIFMVRSFSRRNTGLPVLRKTEVQQLIKERDVLMDDSEMNQAAKFLHDAGIIVHLDDPVMQLCDLYFVDPEWLCNLVAKVVASRDSKHNPITNGVVHKGDLHRLVENDKGNLKLPSSMVPQFLRLLVRFGILLPLSSDEFLIPTKLGSKTPSFTLPGFGFDSSIKRYYELAYIPVSFWPRLITRMLHFLKTLFPDEKGSYPLESERSKKPIVQYWSEGIYIHRSDEFFRIVPSRITNKHSTIEITVPNSNQGYRILCNVVDHVDALLEEWFPGLCGVDPIHGLPLVRRLVPCVVCKGMHAHFFTLDECVQESTYDEYIICPKTAESIPIQRVAPDVVFCDVDEQFRINEFDLILDEISENLLGNGAFGAVYRAKYQKSNEARMYGDDEKGGDLIKNPKKTVAVKVFHSAQDGTPHRMLRREVTFLHRLRHPSIISFVGACLRPARALVLELAPLGSLSSQLKKEQMLSRGLQHRIALQIAEGLAFLHKNMIVYRDLKPQNILIFSLSLGILVNAKIADYGIARYATQCGLTASEGTPGYRAPEVARGDVAYNKEADMYSYGMFLYELVTGGRKPFEDLHFRNEIDKAIVDGRALDPITSSGCPPWPDVTDLIAHLLNPQPEKRPTAEEVYKRLSTAELLCLRRDVAVCKEQTVECMAVRHFVYKGSEKLELWMGSGMSGDNTAQVSWLNLTDQHTEGCQGTMLKDRRVKCMTAVHSDIVLIGCQSGRLWVFEAGFSNVTQMQHKCLHSLPRLPDAVLCLKHYVDTRSGLDLVLAGLANGQLAIYDAKRFRQPDLQPSFIDLSSEKKSRTEDNKECEVKRMPPDANNSSELQNKASPLACITVSRRRVFCGCSNDVIVLQLNADGKLEIERQWSVEDSSRNLVLNIAVGSLVWVSTRDSTVLDTWETSNGVYRGAVDCQLILQKSSITEAIHETRVVSLLLQQSMHQLWVGLGSGHVILINTSTKEPLRIIKRHVSAVRCMEACKGPAFGKPLSLVMTGGMGFIERPMDSGNKGNADFGHALIWEANMQAQINFLDSYKRKRDEFVSSSQLGARESRRNSVTDLVSKGYHPMKRKSTM